MSQSEHIPAEQRLLEERDELEANRCEHGCLPDEYCGDCECVVEWDPYEAAGESPFSLPGGGRSL